MKSCPKCLYDNNIDAEYCSECGEKINSLKEIIETFFLKGNTIDGLYHLKLLAKKNHLLAQVILGDIFSLGDFGVVPNRIEAIQWYIMAINNSYFKIHEETKDVYYNLGVNYNELGGYDNYQYSMNYYKKAVAFKHSMACNNLGICYLQGKGVKQNPSEAVYWLKKALEYNALNELARKNLINAQILNSTSCFIATAVYNSPSAPKVMILREFRDNNLLTNKFGKLFVSFYYKYSPPLANYIAQQERLKKIVRIGFIEPLVWCVTLFFNKK